MLVCLFVFGLETHLHMECTSLQCLELRQLQEHWEAAASSRISPLLSPSPTPTPWQQVQGEVTSAGSTSSLDEGTCKG